MVGSQAVGMMMTIVVIILSFLKLTFAVEAMLTFGTTPQRFCATIDADNANGATGWVSMSWHDGQTRYAYKLDMSGFKEAFPAQCLDDAGKLKDLYHHTHNLWTYGNEKGSAYLAGCGPTETGGHADSSKACSGASEFAKTKCVDLKFTTVDGYEYKCNRANFQKGFYPYCETGDTSGKFGMAKNLGDNKFSQTEALVDYDGPHVASYYVDLMPNALAWRSYVFHCGDASKTRLVCANFKRVFEGDSSPCEFPMGGHP